MDKRELRYLVDDTPQVLPTFGNVAQSFHMTEPPSVKFPGIDIELTKVLHAQRGGQRARRRSRRAGTGRAVTRFTEIWDKGKAAVIWSETTVTAPDGTLLWTQKRSIFARGEGGFGGERGPSTVIGAAAARTRFRTRPSRSRRSRRCCTGCAETAIRCTPTRISLRQQAFRGRSCMGCAPTA